MQKIAFALSLALIFTIPWQGVVNLPGLGTTAKLLGLAMVPLWVVKVLIEGDVRRPRLFHAAVLLFVLWNVLSIFWSADVTRTGTQLVTWVQLLGLVLIIWDLYTTRKALQAGLQAYVLGSYLSVGSAVSTYFSGQASFVYTQRFTSGSDVNPDGFGFILVLAVPVAWYLASSKSTKGFLKIINYAYIPAALLGIALSGTRTALIAVVPAMAYGLGTLSRLKPWARGATLVLLMSSLFVLLPYLQSLESFQRLGTTTTELTSGDLNGRTVIWREGLTSFENHPLLGVGSNMFRSVNSVNKVAHNSFISVLVELGLVGLVLFGAILAIAIHQAWIQPKWDFWFWLSLLAVWTIGASALTWEGRKSTWLFMSLLVASAALERRQEESTEDTPLARAVRELTQESSWKALRFDDRGGTR